MSFQLRRNSLESTGRLQGKVALVIGGSSAIGRAVALAFAKEGARVVIADTLVEGAQETARMIREAGREAISVEADVSHPDGVEALIAKAVETYGRLDCAFCSAAVEGERASTAEEVAEVMICLCWDAA